MAISGLAFFGFLISHLAGNLLLYAPDKTAYNSYSQKLLDLGALLYIAEAGLLLAILLHIFTAIRLKMLARSARPVGYERAKTKQGPSKLTWSSRNLIISGLVLLVFIVLHLKTFKYGPGVEEGYVQNIDGRDVRDLQRLVAEVFQSPGYVVFYVVSMIFLGAHLKHGVWSGFQSLGLTNPRISKTIHVIGILLAIVLAIGFLGMPLWYFFGFGH